MSEKKPRGRPAKASRDPIQILPVSTETVKSPGEFSTWVYAHAPMILQETFDTLPECSPNVRINALLQLYGKSLDYRPYAPITSTNGDEMAQSLADFLKAAENRWDEDGNEVEQEHEKKK